MLCIQDSNWGQAKVDFGDLKPTGLDVDYNERNWLWEFRGKLLVLATPFRRGENYAKHGIMQFLPIIDHLKWLHDNDCVHGDIRAFNIVFSDSFDDEDTTSSTSSFNPAKGCLIDFDFGGKCDDNLVYPQGYINTLPDGGRRGTPGQPISKSDDWYALGQVIFGKHQIKLPKEADGSVFKMKAEVSIRLVEVEDDICEQDISLLKEFIVLAKNSGAQVTRLAEFEKLCLDTKSAHATGSPQKNNNK